MDIKFCSFNCGGFNISKVKHISELMKQCDILLIIIIIISLFRACYTCLSTVHYKHTCIQSYNKQNIC